MVRRIIKRLLPLGLIATSIFLYTPFFCIAGAVTPTKDPVLIIDDFNDNNLLLNSINLNTESSVNDNFAVEEVCLYSYDERHETNWTGYREANACLRLTYDCSLGDEFYYMTNLSDRICARDISEYGYLSFCVKGEDGGEVFWLEFVTSGKNESEEKPMLCISEYAFVTAEWQRVDIPLEAFKNINNRSPESVAFLFRYNGDNPKGTVYIDNLALSNGCSKGESRGSVRIDRKTKRIFADGEPFTVKGVGYQPTPVGENVYPQAHSLECYERDFPLLKEMGCNTIRLWGEPGKELMQAAERYGLKVIACFWMRPEEDYSNPGVCNSIKYRFKKFVERLKDEPALLMWAIGNECNYSCKYLKEHYSLCNELAKIAYETEIAEQKIGALSYTSYHPVMIVNGRLHYIGMAEYGADDMLLNYIDVWGVNLYAKDYNAVDWFKDPENGNMDYKVDIFEVYKAKSSKPLLITEYGADAFCTTRIYPIEGYVDEDAQAEWVKKNTLDIIAAGDVCLGGCVMAYSDEWWKDPYGSNDKHDPGPAALWGGHLPDGYANEEYWGIFSIKDNEGKPDIITPRKVYHVLQSLFLSNVSN